MSATEREAVAIIGIAGRFPGAPSVAALHDLIFAGREGLTDLTSVDVLAAGVTTTHRERHESWIHRAGVIDHIDMFDAERLGIPPREAELMDPQHRIFLEVCYEAIEDAGYIPGAIPSPVGLFAGCGINTYLLNVLLPSEQALELQSDMRAVMGNDRDYLATRVAHRLDLRGPVLTVQSACSTSLAAVHMGVEAILSGQCDIALAGGICIRIPQRAGMPFRSGNIQAADGRCRPFTAAAAGVVNGSGAGAVVLKRLSHAIADADPIRAILLATAMSNDGRRRSGFTAPSPEGQARVISEALALAGVAANTIGYMEAHGTATPLGDRVELSALRRVFGADSDQRGYCALGSVKSNIGHLDTASGVAGIAKLIGAFERRTLPPSPHSDPPHPDLHLEDSPFVLLSTPRPWKTQGAPRRAGISSFGIGGTNVHALLEEPPPIPERPSLAGPFLLCLSARTTDGLRATAQALAAAIEARPTLRLEDVALTLATSRAQAGVRAALVVADRADALLALRGLSPVTAGSNGHAITTRLAMLCRGPLREQMRIAEALARWDAQFACDQLGDVDLLAGDLAGTVFLMATGDLLRRYGVSPDLLAYNRAGAIAAAYLSGALSRDAALRAAAGEPPVFTAARVGLLSLDTDGEVGLDQMLGQPVRPVLPDGLPSDVGFAIDLGDDGPLRKLGAVGPFDDPDRIVEGLLGALGAAWCAGARIDLALACARPRARRTSLPPSHAERESFWIGDSLGEFIRSAPLAPAPAADAPTMSPNNSRFLRVAWVPCEDPPDTSGASGHWLLLGRDDAIARAIATGAESLGTWTVLAGPDAPDPTYRCETGDVQALGRPIVSGASRIIVLWPAQLMPGDDSETACYHVFEPLARALAASPPTTREIIVITRGLASIAGEGKIAPEMSLVLGAMEGLREALPRVHIRCVDVVSAPESHALAAEIARERGRSLVLLRGGDRWVRDFCRSRNRPSGLSPRLRRGGTYLITGGQGELGLIFAIALAERYGARIALLSRGTPPKPEKLTGLPDDHFQVRRARLRERLLAAGVTPLVVQADLGDAQQVRDAVARVVAVFGRIDGAIHAAGLSGHDAFPHTSPEHAKALFTPKVAGTRHLLDALRSHELTFVALCGSLVAWTGGEGQAAYMAANAFLGATARRGVDGNGTEILALEWDVWSETGMARQERRVHAFQIGGQDPVVDRVAEQDKGVIRASALVSFAAHAFERECALDGRPVTRVGTSEIQLIAPCTVAERASRHLRVVFELSEPSRAMADCAAAHFAIMDRDDGTLFVRGRVHDSQDWPGTNAEVPPARHLPPAASGIPADEGAALFIEALERVQGPRILVIRRTSSVPEAADTVAEAAPPQARIFRQLADLWYEVLHVQSVGSNDDFFALGGDSLSAVMLADRVRETLDCRLSVRDLYAHPRLDALARFVAEQLSTPSDDVLVADPR